MLGQKIYELPLSRDYVRHWGMAEAVRELIQNQLDCSSAFEYEVIEDGTLLLHSRDETLRPNTLLLGQTSKADDEEAIGSFGEGYKIAMLVLTRMGYEVEIWNNDRLWIPKFIHNKKYDAEILCILDQSAKRKNRGVTFAISGLSPDDCAEIQESCLQMQSVLGEIKSTAFGEILIDRGGKLYVGGLYICDTDLKYGYNLKPEYITLERDRQTVNGWDLKVCVRDMWFDTEEHDFIAQMMEEGVNDIAAAAWDQPQLVKDACYKRFRTQYPEAIVASSQQELDDLVKEGLVDVRYVGNSHGYYSGIVGGTDYKAPEIAREPEQTPAQYVEQWYKENKRHMRRGGHLAMKKMVKKALLWTNKSNNAEF